jgi:hypothetical protein
MNINTSGAAVRNTLSMNKSSKSISPRRFCHVLAEVGAGRQDGREGQNKSQRKAGKRKTRRGINKE